MVMMIIKSSSGQEVAKLRLNLEITTLLAIIELAVIILITIHILITIFDIQHTVVMIAAVVGISFTAIVNAAWHNCQQLVHMAILLMSTVNVMLAMTMATTATMATLAMLIILIIRSNIALPWLYLCTAVTLVRWTEIDLLEQKRIKAVIILPNHRR